MTGVFRVRSFSGSFQDFRYSLMLWSSESLPCSTFLNAASAETGLLIEAAWKSVASVAGVIASASAEPYALAHRIFPDPKTAIETAGTL